MSSSKSCCDNFSVVGFLTGFFLFSPILSHQPKKHPEGCYLKILGIIVVNSAGAYKNSPLRNIGLITNIKNALYISFRLSRTFFKCKDSNLATPFTWVRICTLHVQVNFKPLCIMYAYMPEPRDTASTYSATTSNHYI
jgi:hypothetical protein